MWFTVAGMRSTDTLPPGVGSTTIDPCAFALAATPAALLDGEERIRAVTGGFAELVGAVA